ncbi:hypothetical protein BDV95DRAFT_300009 [Massariosphaeria phaeospora]|uniref:Integral membrane protein n=1 Tax=Massariosphaeria phaeospora TaxID=100035 RepID=A0A7C8MCJ6_9PLEO|nr:hypothetical protein BDV95DRAFT_300009 [Massariosphaeria phaeospora]
MMPFSLVTLVRVGPLVFSTALLVSNLWQKHAFHAWLHPDSPAPSNVLPKWHIRFTSSSIIDLGVQFVAGLVFGAANLYIRTEGDTVARKWYGASLAFTLAHVVFSKQAIDGLRAAQKVEGAGKPNLVALEKWLAVNRVRFYVSEVPALVAAVMAVGLSLQAA